MSTKEIKRIEGGKPDVVIIGAGLSGITMAIELKKQLGVTPRIFERSDKPGGTWRDNVYPGCACDVPSHWYSLSTELNPNWSKKYSGQEEIFAYWENIYRKHRINEITTFNHSFVHGVWDSVKKTWTITLQPVAPTAQGDSLIPTAESITVTCTHLISTVGGFSTPVDSPPGLPGLETFKGDRWHSARWRNDVDLAGKRVGIVGNGCSAAQIVPQLVNRPEKEGGVGKDGKIVNFMRTPSWWAPRDQKTYSALTKWTFANVPGAMRTYRACLENILDLRYPVWTLSNKTLRSLVEKQGRAYILKTAPKKYHDVLIPKYDFGCKRVIIDPGYLKSLHEPNIDLISDPIARVTENGIVCKSGTEHPLDALILATGFDLSERGVGINLTGINSKKLSDQWNEQGGPQGYLGTTVANFPNFFMILGPNVATGHSSVIASTESQVHYIVKMIEPSVKYGVEALELRREAEENYNQDLQKKLKNTVWQGGCTTYYNLGNKTVATWPGSSFKFWLKTRKPVFEHYRQIGGQVNLAARSRLISRLRGLGFALFFILLAWRLRDPAVSFIAVFLTRIKVALDGAFTR